MVLQQRETSPSADHLNAIALLLQTQPECGVMEAFNPTPPKWTHDATHALKFCCPTCGASACEAQRAWINRRAPVMSEDYQRKWQEFYECNCGTVWWAWSSDRPPSEFQQFEEDDESNPF